MSPVDICSFHGAEKITLRLAGTACVYLDNMVQWGGGVHPAVHTYLITLV